MKEGESPIGKWAAYFTQKDCCSGYGKIIDADEEAVLVDEYPGEIFHTKVCVSNVIIFDTLKEAQECFHKDDEKREEVFFKVSMNR